MSGDGAPASASPTPDEVAQAQDRIKRLVARGRPEDLALANQIADAFSIEFDVPKGPAPKGLPPPPMPEPKTPLEQAEAAPPPAVDEPAAPEGMGALEGAARLFSSRLTRGVSDKMMGAGAAMRASMERSPALARTADEVAGGLSSVVNMLSGTPKYEPSKTPEAYTTHSGRGVEQAPSELATPEAPVKVSAVPTRAEETAMRAQARREEERKKKLASFRGAETGPERSALQAGVDETERDLAEARERTGGLGTAAEVGGVVVGTLPWLAVAPEAPAATLAGRALQAAATGAVAGGTEGALSALGHDQPVMRSALTGAAMGGLMGPLAEVGMTPLRKGGEAVWEHATDPLRSPATARAANMVKSAGVQPTLFGGKAGLTSTPLIDEAFAGARASGDLSAGYHAARKVSKDLARGVQNLIDRASEAASFRTKRAIEQSPSVSAEPLYDRWNEVMKGMTFDSKKPLPAQQISAIRKNMNFLLEDAQDEEHGFVLKDRAPRKAPRELEEKDLGENVTQAGKRGKKSARGAGKAQGLTTDEDRVYEDLTPEQVNKIRGGLQRYYNDTTIPEGERAVYHKMYEQTLGFIQDHVPLLHEANQESAPELESLHNLLSRMNLDPKTRKIDVNELSDHMVKLTRAVQSYSEDMPMTEAMKKALGENSYIHNLVKQARGVADYEALVTRGRVNPTASINTNMTPVMRLGDVGRPLTFRVAGLKNVRAGGPGVVAAAARGQKAGREGGEVTDEDVSMLERLLGMGKEKAQ